MPIVISPLACLRGTSAMGSRAGFFMGTVCSSFGGPAYPLYRNESQRSDSGSFRSYSPLAVRQFPDSRIALHHQVTSVESTCLKIVGVNCKQPPTAEVLAHDSDRPGVWKVGVEALLKFDGNCQPHAIRIRIGRPVPEKKNNLRPYVNSKSAEHGARRRVHVRDCIQDKPVRHCFALRSA